MEQVCTDVACPLLVSVQSKEANLWEMIFFEQPMIPVRKMSVGSLICACSRKCGRSVSLAKPACQI